MARTIYAYSADVWNHFVRGDIDAGQVSPGAVEEESGGDADDGDDAELSEPAP